MFFAADSNMYSDILDTCIKETRRCTMSYKHAACLVHRSQVLIVAHNIERPKIQSYNRSVHAEVNAILKFLKKYPKSLLSQCTMVVIRAHKDGTLANSKPCHQCQAVIVKHGIPKIVFSINTQGSECAECH